jgi:hypothetical protein
LRRGVLLVCLAVLLGAAGWSIVLVSDPASDQTTRSLAIMGVSLFSILAGGTCAQLVKPWLRSRPTSETTRLTR